MAKITMKEIADKLNISINAVSLALNNKAGVSEETRKLVLGVAEEIGYLEKSSKFIQSYASKNICVLIRKLYFEDSYFYSKIMMGIVEESRKNGYDILTCMINENEKNIPGCIENKKVCGIIVIGAIEDEYLVTLKEYRIPVVLVDHTSLLESTDSILTDNKLGSFKITKLLFDKGYRNIGFFGDLNYSLSIKERFFGYQEAIKKALEIDINGNNAITEYIEELSILCNLETHIINQDHKKIQEIIKSMYKLPEAFVCSNDNAAILLINSLKELGYAIPKDMAIVGFDDIALSSLVVPKITTVRVQKDLMGRKAVKRLLWRLDHKSDQNENIVMSVDIVERDSIAIK
ncbi:LacI family DNA-binding transcriptional regulator [Clostridium gasigenes]|uniref:LacI family DNA-binding transcriptional regulator n=1 Tax=Clostridium gasigenes TaxID=94869 RepID=UPI0014384D6E|nr:LacI family DNA-binding transcriptional regulator [Clostridium gasigenes]MBB6622096.1 LacI family DNA-binding transcriptional regulator [Clostridium gasigenes]MBU3086935.1 LacI family DNA-binding transcriptional regulator [Clostridium gasigenes]MBU3131251.1 LacI family DNA-binding transcriptional regulator [Clostridium gasigenes]NKF08148.1 LacI family transcriptional regulator [Clostridium gasigenes]QSW18501.1 LacI family DNA-binding transcriptional regulator [Clostridium gasigenes]